MHAPPNSPMKLAAAGFGPGLKPLGRTPASRRHVGCITQHGARAVAAATAMPRAFGTRALPLQLIGLTVRPPQMPEAQAATGSGTALDKEYSRS